MTQAPLSGAIVLAWGSRVSTDFARGVFGICRDFGWGADHPSWLMACMAFETGETFSPSVRNAAGSGAVGLIQFMPSTTAALGTTVENLQLLSAESQLTYVSQYFKPYARRIASLSDMYMAILLPKYIGQPEDAVLFSGGIGYRQNAGLDTNRDGKITKAEASALIKAKLQRGLQPGFVANYAGGVS
ncbi:MAG: lytic transglycosylase [Rhodanobacter sp.]